MAAAGFQPLAGQAFHYRDTGSPLHRLGGGWKLLGLGVFGAAALAARGPLALGALAALGVGGYRLAGLRAAEVWQDVRWLALQGAVVVALYLLRDGAAGVGPGVRTALQLLLFFLPGALLLRTTSSAQLREALHRALPPRLAFGLSTSLRLMPAFSRELHEIWMAQRLRGARLGPREIWRPQAWRDWTACVGLPLTVRAIRMAQETALAAEIRGLPRRDEPLDEPLDPHLHEHPEEDDR
jgi:energy-coupling factor transport system permease protein